MTRHPTKRERDTQRSRVYKADEAIRHLSRAELSTVPAIEAYVRRMWSLKRLQQAYPEMMHGGLPKVGDGRARSRRAGGNSGGIYMPRWARYETLVIHELAHTVTQRVYGFKVAGHGWQYCEVYLTLMLHMMGRPAHDALKAAFRQYRVRYTKPRAPRALTDEQRATLAARLGVARAKRRLVTIQRASEAPALALFETFLNGRG